MSFSVIFLFAFAGALAATAMPLAQTQHVAYGDSITAGAGLKKGQTYVEKLSQEAGARLINRAVSGQTACQMSFNQVFANPIPSLESGSNYSTMMIGTNDSNIQGAGEYEKIFSMCLRASMTWLTIPDIYKVFPKSPQCILKGNWKSYPTASSSGVMSTNQGDSIICQVTSLGGPLYLWMGIGDGYTGILKYTVGNNVSSGRIKSFTTQSIKMIDGRGNEGQAAIRLVLPEGQHQIEIKVDSVTSTANRVIFYGVGTLAPVEKMMGFPKLFVGGVPFQRSDKKSAASKAYSQRVQNLVDVLKADGLPVYFVETRAYMTGSSDEMYDDLHPTPQGQNRLLEAFRVKILGTY